MTRLADHLEISSVWGSSGRFVDYVRSKFSNERVRNVIEYVDSITSSNNVVYEKQAIFFTSCGILGRAKRS